MKVGFAIGAFRSRAVCVAAETAWRAGKAPLNAVEGFIRQILGWREYVRGIYWLEMPAYAQTNALEADRPLPGFYWSGETAMNCLANAIADGARVIVKIDGDGQMAPELLPQFVAPILEGLADYTKGNRFYDLTNIGRMPGIRLLGNAMLSFMSKFSTGYWDIFDPTNGYTAIHARVASHLPFDKISQRYFFESDMLFRLNIMRCVVMDIPMDAHYADEVSNLRIRSILGEFMFKHLRNFGKRIFYNYFLRDLSAASFHLLLGTCLTIFGLLFGAYQWTLSASMHVVSSAGTVMLAALPLLLGLQLLLAFISHDTQSVPRLPIHKRLYRSTPPLRQPERPSP